MSMTDLSKGAAGRRRFAADLSRLLAAAGSRHFDDELQSITRDTLGCTCFVALHFENGERQVLARTGSDLRTDGCEAAHSSEFDWRRDPTNIFLVQELQAGRVYAVVSENPVTACDRAAMGGQINVGRANRLSVIWCRDRGHVKLDFFLAHSGSLLRNDPKIASDYSEFIYAVIARHGRLSQSSQHFPDAIEHLDSSLKRYQPSLSPRQRQVCSLIAYGLTMEGVSLKLGISVHTAANYRRRAFEKMNISMNSELIKLAM